MGIGVNIRAVLNRGLIGIVSVLIAGCAVNHDAPDKSGQSVSASARGASAPTTVTSVSTSTMPAPTADPTVAGSAAVAMPNASAASDASDASDASVAATQALPPASAMQPPPALPTALQTPIVPPVPSAATVQRSTRQEKRVLLAAYEAKLRRDRAIVNAYQQDGRERHQHNDRLPNREHFLHRMLQDGLSRLSPPELLEWAQLQSSLADRAVTSNCSNQSPLRGDGNQAMNIDALSVDQVARYLGLSYQAIHDAVVHKTVDLPGRIRVEMARMNLAAQVVALISQRPEDAKRLAIFEAEGEKKTTADRCWMAALGMRAALRLPDPDRDIILRSMLRSQREAAATPDTSDTAS